MELDLEPLGRYEHLLQIGDRRYRLVTTDQAFASAITLAPLWLVFTLLLLTLMFWRRRAALQVPPRS